MINAEISDSDEDDDDDDVHGGYIGYQALAQDSGMINQDSDTEDESQVFIKFLHDTEVLG